MSAVVYKAPGWWKWAATGIFPSHFVLTALTMGLRVEHYILDIVFLGFAWLPGRWGALSYWCIPYFLTATSYDNGRYLKRFRRKTHVDDIYHAEVKYFGVRDKKDGKRKTWAEWFVTRTHPVLDLFCGFAYLFFLYEITALGIGLFFYDPGLMTTLAWSFFLVNVLGMLTQTLYPAAPPWYVMHHGLGPADHSVKPHPAGAARFDKLLGITYFDKFYARNPTVFGAMPSLHVAYPTLCWCACAYMGWGWHVAGALFALLVAFSAIYLQHHYIWDVLFGALYAVVTFFGVVLFKRFVLGGSGAAVMLGAYEKMLASAVSPITAIRPPASRLGGWQ